MKFQSLTLMLALGVSTAPMADQLGPIVVEDTVPINPNAAEADSYYRVSPTSSDGGEFLTQVNGVSMSRFGGRGLEPIIRGQSQTRLNILLDGAYLHGGCPNRMDPPSSWAALETYESVTVLKGVQTLLYGGGGSGGTVLFERDTRDLARDHGLHGRLSLMGSDNAIEHDVLGDVVASSAKGYLRGIGELKKARNYEDGDGTEIRSSFDHKQSGLIVGATPTQDRLFELSAEHNKFSDALYPGAGMDSPNEEGDIYRLRYLDKPANTAVDSVRAEFYLSDVDHLMDNYSLRPNNGTKMATPTTSRTTGGRVTLSSMLSGVQWDYGVDLQRNERNAELRNMTSGTPVVTTLMWPGMDIRQLGAVAEGKLSVDPRRNLKFGLRVDRVDVSADKADVVVNGHTANQSYTYYYGEQARNRDETNIGALLRHEHRLSSDLTAFVGLSRSVRTADATERGMNKWTPPSMASSRWVGNPAIDPEVHHQLDAGLSKDDGKMRLGAVIFFDDVSDYILRDSARGQPGILRSDGAEIYRNVDAELYGVELEASRQLAPRLDLSASLAWVHATNTTDDRPLPQTPPLNGKIQLDYGRSDWNLGGRINFADRQDRIDELSRQEVGETPGWATLDLYAGYHLTNGLAFRVGIDNALDKTYAEHASRSNLFDPQAIKVNEPGRTVWAKVNWEF